MIWPERKKHQDWCNEMSKFECYCGCDEANVMLETCISAYEQFQHSDPIVGGHVEDTPMLKKIYVHPIKDRPFDEIAKSMGYVKDSVDKPDMCNRCYKSLASGENCDCRNETSGYSTEKNELEFEDNFPPSSWCDCCGVNSNHDGQVNMKPLYKKWYCFSCYPKMVEVKLAEDKLSRPTAKSDNGQLDALWDKLGNFENLLDEDDQLNYNRLRYLIKVLKEFKEMKHNIGRRAKGIGGIKVPQPNNPKAEPGLVPLDKSVLYDLACKNFNKDDELVMKVCYNLIGLICETYGTPAQRNVSVEEIENILARELHIDIFEESIDELIKQNPPFTATECAAYEYRKHSGRIQVKRISKVLWQALYGTEGEV